MRPKYAQKKREKKVPENLYHMSIFLLFDYLKEMLHKYSLRLLKHFSYFVFVKINRSVTKGANFKCFEHRICIKIQTWN